MSDKRVPSLEILGQPLLWLTLQLLAVFAYLIWSDSLETLRVADTLSYLNATQASGLEDILSRHRTFGYPLFLRAVISFGHWLAPVATVQVLLFYVSIPLFWWALREVSGSAWLAWAAVFPLPFAGVMSIAKLVQPDFLAAVATVVAVSCLLLLVAGSSRLICWAGLAVAVFLAYQLRPAAVFLVGLLPVLGILWRWILGERRNWLRWATTLVLTTVLPFLAFCLLRLAVVGHFGVVSFGGMNLAGLTANFLDGRLIRELPAEDRKLARSMFRLRRQRGWETMTRDSVMLDHFKQYSDNIWDVALPAASKEHRRLVRLPEGHPERPPGVDRPPMIVKNDLLTRTSRAMVRLRPALYLKWVRGSILYGLDQLLDFLWILGPALLLLVLSPLYVLRTRGRTGANMIEPRVYWTLVGLTVLGVGYFSAYLILVALVSFPFTRYFVSMTLFLPTMLSALLFVVTARILQPDR